MWPKYWEVPGDPGGARPPGQRVNVGSLFSGIGGFDLGLEQAGHHVLWQVEIDAACRSVLERRFRHPADAEGVQHRNGADAPDSQPVGRRSTSRAPAIHVDVRTVGRDTLAPVDLVCGGFPCQDLSVAGKRAGLAGERSGLWHEFHRVVAELAPRWVLVENVPGLLSSNEGRDFAVILSGLVELGYGVAWRVLDAQHFGVPQRRRRVFIVGCLGDWAAPSSVLFEPESVSGDSPPRREARKGVAGTLGGGSGERGWAQDTDRMTFLPSIASSLDSHRGGVHNGQDDDGGKLVVAPLGGGNYGQGNFDEGIPNHVLAPSLRGFGHGWQGQHNDDASRMSMVRRLTPTECERLQGFPDGWTAGQSDSTRYRQLGNAVAVPVARWIGSRLLEALQAAAVTPPTNAPMLTSFFQSDGVRFNVSVVLDFEKMTKVLAPDQQRALLVGIAEVTAAASPKRGPR